MTTPPPAAPGCPWCSAPAAVVDGRYEPHRQRGSGFGPGFDHVAGVRRGEPCPLSGAVPWRRGTPDEAAVRRHLQEHPSVETRAAHFQVRAMGLFLGVLVASFETEDESGPVQWGYGLPRDAAGETHAGVIHPPAPDADRFSSWEFRPMDLGTGEIIPWRDAPGGA